MEEYILIRENRMLGNKTYESYSEAADHAKKLLSEQSQSQKIKVARLEGEFSRDFMVREVHISRQ